MQYYEKQELLDSLHRGSQVLMDALGGLSEEASGRQPADGRWSILQCVEHLALAEEYLFGQILAATASDSPLVNERREGLIRERGADRGRRIAAPEVVVPHGRYRTLAEVCQGFSDIRAQTIRFVENCSADLRAQLTTHPIIAGPVNVHEMLLMIAAHPFRHAEQIREIRAAKDTA